jgi:hypothetical protein
MSKGKSPQSQIGGSIRNTSKNEFNSFNDLMYEYFTKIKFSSMSMSRRFFNQSFLFLSFFRCSTVLTKKDERFNKQHNRNHDESSDEEVELYILLSGCVIERFSFSAAHFQGHVDHDVDDSRRRVER